MDKCHGQPVHKTQMILELRAEVESTTVLQEEFAFSFEGKDVLLIPKSKDGKNVVAEISIRKRIPDEAGFRTVSRPPLSGAEPAYISAVGFEGIAEELTTDLQFMESLLSLYGVTRVSWDAANHSFIPETDGEKHNLQVYSLRLTKGYPPVYLNLRTDWMNESIGRLRELTVPLAFFREGSRSYLSFNYIAAFQNHYFILEGYYAKGSHKNQESSFLSDAELLGYARAAYSQHIQQIADKLDPMFKFYKLRPSPESFLRLAVKVRHRLHHYFQGRQETYFGTPLSQELYQPISLALMLLCTHILFGKRSSLLAK